MKQITAENLLDIIHQTNTRPLLINGYSITGIIKGINFNNIHFADCQFFNFGVISSSFIDCKFVNTKITYTNFESIKVLNCSIQDSSISSTTFVTSHISTTKIANVVATKMIFDQSQIEYTKFVCNSLIATKFLNCKFLDAFFEYNTLDASIIDSSVIHSSMFLSTNMRGVHITNSKIENTLMDYINFDDSANVYPSEFFIPARNTNIRGNEVENLTITNTILHKSFKDFIKYSNTRNKTSFASITHKIIHKENKKKDIRQKQHSKEVEVKKESLHYEVSSKNISSAITFAIQTLLTIFIVHIFTNFYKETSTIFYKSIPNIIKFPLSFVEQAIEVHHFAFYFSLLYFVFSGILFCINVVCIRGVKSVLLAWLYRLQSLITMCVLGWIYWNSLQMQSGVISMLNLFFACYFFIMIIQSFKTKSGMNYEGSRSVI